MPKRIFISVANEEHEVLRADLRDVLVRAGFDVVVQPDFPHTAADTVRKLDGLIGPCDLVIHIVGRIAGSRANAKAVEDFFNYVPRADFLAACPEAQALLGDCSALTYFQWEAWLAHHRGTDLLVYGVAGHKAADFPQRAHLDALYLARHHAEELKGETIRSGQIVADAFRHFGMSPPDETPIISAPKFLHHTAETFLGREKELERLDESWADGTNLMSLIAWGGVGKTALLSEWLQTRFIDKHWQDGEGHPLLSAYFDWTFYDQGTRGTAAETAEANAVRTGSVGDFFEKAIHHFDPGAEIPPAGKGRQLAKLVQGRRSLLILDGLEPLQQPPGNPQAGRLTDPDLYDLLYALAMDNPGLCLISSRQHLTDLRGLRGKAAAETDLEDLPKEVATSLLRKLQITGTDEELAAACDAYGCHALSLTLLGRYLFDVHDGDVRCIDRMKDLRRADELTRDERQRTAWKVLQNYNDWLSSSQSHPRMLAVLRLTGLFDRPADAACLAVLREEPAIPGLTEAVMGMREDEWKVLLKRLESARLIKLRPDAARPGAQAIDAHPLVREYFAMQLRAENPEGFKAAHSRLFDYLCESAAECTKFDMEKFKLREGLSALVRRAGQGDPDAIQKFLGLLDRGPETIHAKYEKLLEHLGLHEKAARPLPTFIDLQPLYQAINHGCLAGLQCKAFEKVYLERILRGTGENGYFSSKKLGATSADLRALAAFFQDPWIELLSGFDEQSQALLFNQAASRLRALGRTLEALEPIRKGLEIRLKCMDWLSASRAACNLSEVELTLGNIIDALADSRRAIELASHLTDLDQKIMADTTCGNVLHHAGMRAEAHTLFEGAEKAQAEFVRELPELFSIQGCEYADLLLAPTELKVWCKVLSMCSSVDSKQYLQSRVDAESIDLECLKEIRQRVGRALERVTPSGSLLEIASARLAVLRVAFYGAVLNSEFGSTEASEQCAAALLSFREANRADRLPLALLTAAFYHGTLGNDPEQAERFLTEAQQIAERGPMPLYLADVHLHRARLFRNREELAKAHELIHSLGYGRRYRELADAEAAALHWPA